MNSDKSRGIILVNVLIFAAIAATVTGGLVNWGAMVLKTTRTLHLREQALQIAEAGVEYYRWHLAHAKEDYTDGTGASGPYVHEYKDAEGNVVGEYSLDITPPDTGSTIVKILSTGTLTVDPSISRTIEVTMALPSLAKYAVVANANMRFGPGTEVFGHIHSNGGIRFDGKAYNLVTSALSTYNDTDVGGAHVYGVYTTVPPEDPDPPAPVPDRPDVFVTGRIFPVPIVDFSSLTSNLASLKEQAQADGTYIPSSGKQGYHMILKTDDTYDLYSVTSIENPPHNCGNSGNQGGWNTWSIKAEQFIGNYAFPVNGIIFLEDHVWVEGKINTARITIAAGRFPEAPGQYRKMILFNDLLYTNYDGKDVVALIAQGDIDVSLNSADILRIDAALVAQKGRAGRYYYSDDCGDGYIRDTITLYGMIASNGRYGFAYTDGTGYINRNIIYDNNLLYAPPPSFPLTSNQYQVLSWREVQ